MLMSKMTCLILLSGYKELKPLRSWRKLLVLCIVCHERLLQPLVRILCAWGSNLRTDVSIVEQKLYGHKPQYYSYSSRHDEDELGTELCTFQRALKRLQAHDKK